MVQVMSDLQAMPTVIMRKRRGEHCGGCLTLTLLPLLPELRQPTAVFTFLHTAALRPLVSPCLESLDDSGSKEAKLGLWQTRGE